ncbi:MAG: hypothetical protein GQ564_17895 [Bacteroidales bacterium]|nr:hypothetical protein [Bacteroidales bacterium]
MKYFITILFCITAITINAQSIENFKSEQKGGELLFHYDLKGSKEDLFKVSFMYSTNDKDWLKLDKIYRDVGDSILTGNDKNAVLWLDHLPNITEKIFFKVVAEYYTINDEKEGILSDKVGNTYNWVRIGKNNWMTHNLKIEKTDDNCGGYFNNSNARNACPDNWQLPSDEDWMALEVVYGVNKAKVKEHGLREINITELVNAGFNIEECKYQASLYPNQKAIAFWTSSQNKMLYTGYSDKYFARIVRLNENKISKELRMKTEELNVRCVQSAIYLAKIEANIETILKLNPVSGVTKHPFTGEKLEWQYIGGAIWQKHDITGSYMYKETSDRCPTGWRIPEKEEWEKLLKEFKPSIKLTNHKEVLSDRLSASGLWSFNLSSNDYWLNTHYYTYNTFWINEKDKEDSEKTMSFPSNKKGEAEWVKKQTNEKAKVRCVLDNVDYISKKDAIKKGTIIDKRDNKEYGFVEIDDQVWLSENLSFDLGENSSCRDNIKTDCDLFGHMYKLEVVNSGCPDGWRLPTSKEWKYLLINKAANNLKILYPFGGTGFNLLLGSEMVYDEEKKSDYYTAKYLFNDGEKTGYYYINSYGKVELNEKAKKKDSYYVRCIKK